MDFIFDKQILQTYFSSAFLVANKTIRKIGFPIELKRLPDPGEMITLEQQLNLNHLVGQVLFYQVPGDVIELGCFTGASALQIRKVIDYYDTSRKFHVFDSFKWKHQLHDIDVRTLFTSRFDEAGLTLPEIHEGYFEDTLKDQLPDQISFLHIDCGTGCNPCEHSKLLQFCLEQVYPRMSRGAICLLMDYHDRELTLKGLDMNPGVKMACDLFFRDKKEKVSVLYGNHYSHGYFRKLS